jgi:hypothetical protein
MNAKLTFFAGVAVGGVAVAALLSLPKATPQGAPPQAVQSSSAQVMAGKADQSSAADKALEQIAKLEAENNKLARQVQSLMAKAEDAEAKAKASASKSAKGFALFKGDDSDTNGMSGMLQTAMKAQMEQQLEAKLLKMKTRLNLTADQETQIRAKLEAANKAASAMAMKMFNGGGQPDPAEVADAGQAAGDTEKEIEALLTPEQKAGYAQLKTEENQNNARLVANSELLQMQNVLGLSQDQQDKVFNVLYDQTQAMMTNPGAVGTDLAGMVDKKTEALKGILTDQQMEAYQKMQQQQLQLIQSFTGAAKDNGSPAAPKAVQSATIITIQGKP